MKWYELKKLEAKVSIITRIGSGYRAVFLGKKYPLNEISTMIEIQWRDDRLKAENFTKEVVDAQQFSPPSAPRGTVPRVNNSS